MLQRLYIKNFAIVDELEISFSNGFQVITGETGAGKSIIVGAIGLLCGERGSTEIVRAGAQKAIMEGEFVYNKSDILVNLLKKSGIESIDDKIIVRREVNERGVSRAFINDSPVTIGVLANISDYLIDLHGQHQHQRLLRPETHVEYLDAYGQLDIELAKYIQAFKIYRQSVQKLKELKIKHTLLLEKQELYKFQIDELEKANLTNDEYDKLEKERKILENSEQLFDKARSIADNLYSSDVTVLHQITKAGTQLKQMASIDESFTNLLQNLETARVTIEEVGLQCEQYCTNLEFDPARLEEIRTRQAELEWLMKKYHVNSLDQLIENRDDLKKQVFSLENFERDMEELKSDIEKIRTELQLIALNLSEERKRVASGFQTEMNNALHLVGLKNARFEVEFNHQLSDKGEIEIDGKRYLLNDMGMDLIEFSVGLNVGEPVKPLHKVASGGEVSRIMLCIKSLLADSDNIETLVFDEIDNGISGKFAQIVGKKMRQMSAKHQLIVITHLPQIAAQGTGHYSVNKFETDGRTQVEVIKLDDKERIEDIAKLLGGENITEHTRANARELLGEIR
jgi:DNA repair protein RecN (Recombination protein N)